MPKPELLSARSALLANFKCQQTGACCRAEGYVYVTDTDIANMAQHLGKTEADFRAEFVRPDGQFQLIASPTFRRGCFLDSNNRCQVYEHRPDYCRKYPRCPEVWETEADVHVELKKCRGMQLAYEAVFKKRYISDSDS